MARLVGLRQVARGGGVMREFWRMYKRNLQDYPSSLGDVWRATKEFAGCLLLLTLPLTFPVIYPIVMLWRKVKP